MIYTITFNPALDYMIQLGQLKLGGVNRAVSESIQCGGKGVNVSLMLHNLGVKSIILGFVAGCTGQIIKDRLAGLGIKEDLVTLLNGFSRINVKLQAEQETEINGQGPAIGPEDLEVFYEKFQQFHPGDIVVIAGSIPPGCIDGFNQAFLDRLAERSVRLVVDADGPLLMDALKYRPFLIKPNHIELGELFGKELCGTDHLVAHACLLQKKGAANVLVSMAKDGSLLVAEDGNVYHQPAAKGSVRNSVGAGDSMVAGFLAAWLETGDYQKALQLGTAAGGAAAFSDGFADRNMVEKLLKTLKQPEIIGCVR